MKINTGDFKISRIPQCIKDNNIVTNDPKSNAENEWEEFIKSSAMKKNLQNPKENKMDDFYNNLIMSKIENESAVTTYNLVSQNVLKTIHVEESHSTTGDLRQCTLNNLRLIFKSRTKELLENFKDEDNFYSKYNSNNNCLTIEDNEIGIYFNHKVSIKAEDVAKISESANGLSCIIKYKDLELRGYLENEFTNELDRCAGYFRDKELNQVFVRKDLEVKITSDVISNSNKVCEYIITEVRKGKRIECMYNEIIYKIGEYLFENLTSENRICDTENEVEMDGFMSKTIWRRTTNGIYKLTMFPDGFDIFLNGRKMYFKSHKQ